MRIKSPCIMKRSVPKSLTMSSQKVNTLLEELINNLKHCINGLKSPLVSSELENALHNHDRLPDQQVGNLSATAVDLLGEAELLLKPGHLILAGHFLGYTDTKCLLAAVQLRIPDTLTGGPLTLDEIATRCSANPIRLKQILCSLYNNGIFAWDAATCTYANNHVSRLLLADHPTQWHNWVDLYGQEFYDIARGIPGSVRADSQRTAAQINFDTDQNMFAYFQQHGLVPRLHQTLGGGAAAMAPGILEDYPWGEIADRTIMDVGGGSGAMLTSLLRRFPGMRGGVFELKHVISHIGPFFRAGGQFEDIGDRVPEGNLISGNFLEAVPASEVYIMKWVLHDWGDEDAVAILRNIRRAIVENRDGSRLILLESILADGRSARLSRLGDINMMTMTAHGMERSEAEWRTLAEKAGWNHFRVFRLRRSWVDAIELKP
ncbi:Myricetin O-methyltransferase [Daldinia childiae]|uniref:Myricetin O-methyltransferase n=1 Tax=Daldinia childiae TaxID=326645 RepID=UPI0014479AF6|nr:Myricetin O-methyltransferase [Daldinia childiae]KAF3058036.1 Myricetin O-methyltransferase [Daldinia childiae]